MKFPAEKEQMVIENMGLVRKVAWSMSQKFRSPLVSYDDMLQVGSMGLMKAVETFDESRGLKFSSLAYKTIRGYIMHELSRSTPIRAPARIVSLASLILKRGQQDDPPEELAEFYKCPLARINNALHHLIFNVVSTDAKVNHDAEKTFHNYHGTTIDYDDSMIVQEFFDSLKPNYQDVLRRLMDDELMTKIAEARGVNKQRIHAMKMELREKWVRFESGEVVIETRGRPRGSGRSKQ